MKHLSPRDPQELLYNKCVIELRCEKLVKFFGPRQVLKGIDLTVRKGEIVGLLGRNGAGKTTTFHCIVGFLQPDEGKILLNGEDITFFPTHQRALLGITYLPQEHSVFQKATVIENLEMVLEHYMKDKKKLREKAEAILEQMKLSHLKNSKAMNLSGGEKRRLEIARALTLEPKFLLLDEPFSGIDPITVGEIQEIVLDLKNRGIAVVITDHNVMDVFAIADRAYIIDEGEVIAEGSPQELAQNELAKKRFLGEDFSLEI